MQLKDYKLQHLRYLIVTHLRTPGLCQGPRGHGGTLNWENTQ